ncbi:MAG TPA: [protein-PII] uridylyltransferase [Casimicrobiaceae bacterium]|nr:[protein-PII] uridylyltransferase [Casimicrobiaceae bacterium]
MSTALAPAANRAADTAAAPWKRELDAGQRELEAAYRAGLRPRRLLAAQARLTDRVLRGLWTEIAPPPGLALVAVGGYGRGELFPHSDVDVVLLLPRPLAAMAETTASCIERFIGLLWDTGLEIGHSVRTVDECEAEMEGNAVSRTSLLERRLLAGSRALYARFGRRFEATLDVRSFYEAKALEQQQRHLRYQDTAYNLEPNLKESPGGRRDMQTILWIARAAGFGHTWRELAARGLMTAAEARELTRNETLIDDLRIRLHYLARRREDRLVFDLQSALASELGLSDTPSRRASEQLMQRYYRAAKSIRQLNVILLQNLHARLFPAEVKAHAIDADFQAVDELLDIRDDELFAKRPGAILDSFLTLQRHPELKGMSAPTLRALWRHRKRVDAAFRRDPENRARFLAILRQPHGVTHELRRMNQYGILGRYIPAYGRIVGQMQHDLYHVYTVDEHILMVIRNLRRFTESQHGHEYPLCSRLIADFARPEVLYVAALFHDIAKGRGGNHSRLGAIDARRFCRQHGLATADTNLVGWLVAKHLSMSLTAQKQDLSDPAVIAAFAAKVRTERRLAALYLLTVADIRGTSPRVWNAWKAKLLEDLFHAARARLTGRATPATLDDSLEARRIEAARQLRLYAIPDGAEQALWRQLDGVYFQRHSADEIAWHARQLYFRVDGQEPVVRARLSRSGAGLQVMIYLPDQKELFARLCGFFGKARLSILDAKIHTTGHGYALDTFLVHDPFSAHAAYRAVISFVEFELGQLLAARAPLEPPPIGRISRHLKHFPLTPEVRLFPDDKGTHYILELVAGDRPGLLARIAYTLAKANVNVESAKINTLGERAEDVFLLDGARLHDEAALLRLETALYEQLQLR